MGGAVTTGRNNNDLVDNLLSAEYVRTPAVQKLLRAVDRADYFLPHCRRNAYRDLAWKSGHLHLSAPCIYSEVLEGLCLRPNLSFLNLGSGTGYLSTIVGLALGCGGVNHGVEIYEDVIEYAQNKLEEFKMYSAAIDEYDLCEPRFIQGNCLCLSSGTMQYDRVYCSGLCPASYISYLKNLIKVGGILVMPIEDQLMQIERTSETTWEERSLLPVSFATLVVPEAGSMDFVNLFDAEPLSLQEMCRTVIRNVIRNNITKENPHGIFPKVLHKLHQFPNTDDDSDNETSDHSQDIQSRTFGALIDIVLGRLPDDSSNAESSSQFNTSSDSTYNDCQTEPSPDSDLEIGSRPVPANSLHSFSSINTDAVTQSSNLPNSKECLVAQSSNNQKNEKITEHDQRTKTSPFNSNSSSSDINENSTTSDHLNRLTNRTEVNPAESELLLKRNEDSRMDAGNGNVIARITIRKRNRDGIEESNYDFSECDTQSTTSNLTTSNTNETLAATKTKREKFDSGLGDEIVNTLSDGEGTNELNEGRNRMEIDSSSSSDEDDEQQNSATENCRETHWRTVTVPTYAVDHLLAEFDNEVIENEVDVTAPRRPIIGPYTILMRNRINELPLPQTLKNYVNYYKEF